MDHSQIIEKLAQLKEPFAEDQVRSRTGADNKEFKYIPTILVTERLDQVFPLAWSWEILDNRVDKSVRNKRTGYNKDTQPWTPIMEDVTVEVVSVLGRLSFQLSETKVVFRDAWGGADAGKGSASGDDFKIAATNAMKKAAYMFGVGGHIGLDVLEHLDDVKPDKPKKQYNNSGKNNWYNNSGQSSQDSSSQQTAPEQPKKSTNPLR